MSFSTLQRMHTQSLPCWRPLLVNRLPSLENIPPPALFVELVRFPSVTPACRLQLLIPGRRQHCGLCITKGCHCQQRSPAPTHRTSGAPHFSEFEIVKLSGLYDLYQACLLHDCCIMIPASNTPCQFIGSRLVLKFCVQ
jgi:hypothetical protein